MSNQFGQSHSLLTRMKRHGQISVMFRAPADRLHGDWVNPNEPVLRADYYASGIGPAPIRRPIVPSPPMMPSPMAAQPIFPTPLPTPVQSINRAPSIPQPAPVAVDVKAAPVTIDVAAKTASRTASKPNNPIVIPPTLSEYRPSVEASDAQLFSIVAAHARKQASGEAYEVRNNSLLAKKERPKDGPVGKANLRRHMEAKEKIAKQGVDSERLRRRPAVSYVGAAALGAVTKSPVAPKQTRVAVVDTASSTEEAPPTDIVSLTEAPPPAPNLADHPVPIDADEDLLETMNGETVAQPLLTEHPDSDGVIAAELRQISAEQQTDSSIDLVLPRRARPTRPQK